MFGNFIPVDDLPEGAKIVGAFVLIFQIIGVFPNVDAQDRSALYFGYIHQWVVLVGGGRDLQLSVLYDQPCPAAAETADAGGIELFFESIEAAKGGANVIGQLSSRGAGRLGAQNFPEKAVIDRKSVV